MSYLLRQQPQSLLGGHICALLRESRVGASQLAEFFGVNGRKMRRLLNGTTKWSVDDWVWMCEVTEHYTSHSAISIWRWSMTALLAQQIAPDPIPELEGRRLQLRGSGGLRRYLSGLLRDHNLCVDDLCNWSGQSNRRVRRILVSQTLLMDDISWLVSFLSHHTCVPQDQLVDDIYYLALMGEIL